VKIGYHCEGNDGPILHCLVCRLLGITEESIRPLLSEHRSGSTHVLSTVELVLDSFYLDLERRAVGAVVEVDNDGQVDLRGTGLTQDPARPRHWVHVREPDRHPSECQFCRLHRAVQQTLEATQDAADYVTAAAWPVVICVPTEAIESWLLIARGLTEPEANDLLDAESRPAGVGLKRTFYGRDRASLSRVQSMALPLLRGMDDVRRIGDHSKSFRLFARQVLHLRRRIEAAAACLGGSPS